MRNRAPFPAKSVVGYTRRKREDAFRVISVGPIGGWRSAARHCPITSPVSEFKPRTTLALRSRGARARRPLFDRRARASCYARLAIWQFPGRNVVHANVCASCDVVRASNNRATMTATTTATRRRCATALIQIYDIRLQRQIG